MKGPWKAIVHAGIHRVHLILGSESDENLEERFRKAEKAISKAVKPARSEPRKMTSILLKIIATSKYKEEGFVRVDT